MKKGFWVKKIIGFVVFGSLLALALSWVVMSLWNGVLVVVLGVKMVTFWQAAGILLLSKILFGGFKGKNSCCPGREWKNGMKEKWNNMTPEDREKFKAEWRSKCRSNWFCKPNLGADLEVE